MANGDDDDRIDDLVDALEETNRELSRLTDFLTQSVGGETEQQQAPPVDKYSLGDQPGPVVSTPSEYIEARSRAANSMNIGPPALDMDEGYTLTSFFLEVYTRGGEHLQRVRVALGESLFDQFIRLLAIEYGCEEELVMFDNDGRPVFDSSSFGVFDVRREVNVDYSNTPFSMFKIEGNHYHIPPLQDIVSLFDFEGPPSPIMQLGLDLSVEDFNIVQFGEDRISDQPQIDDEGNYIILGGMTPFEMNKSMARSIAQNQQLELPLEYTDLL